MAPLQPHTGAIVAKHIALLLIGLALGAWYSRPFAGLAAAAAAALLWHVYHLRKLLAWTHSPKDTPVPEGGGTWAAVFSNVHYMRQNAKRSKKRQRDLLKRWRRVTNALPDAGIVLDGAFGIVQYNEATRRILGLGDTDPVGLPVTNILRNPSFVEMINEARFERPIRIVFAGEPARALSCQVSRYGKDRYLLIVRDVTDRERAERVKADFVANASHELRTPLTVLHGYLTSMSEDAQLGDQWHEPVQEMALQVTRMQSLVADLLCLNELETQHDAPLIATNLGALLDQACREARRLADERVDITLDAQQDADILGDASALRSIVTNLLSNAVRFTPAGGRIDVRWWRDDDGGHLRVRDDGIGIETDDIERVTERFYRTDPGRARHQGGTGLGLAIVKHALSMHQAHLEIVSELEVGSSFTCHFPAARITEGALRKC